MSRTAFLKSVSFIAALGFEVLRGIAVDVRDGSGQFFGKGLRPQKKHEAALDRDDH